MEALQLLREWGMKGETPVEEDDCYVFGEKRLPKTTPTPWRSRANANVFFTLQVLELCLRYEKEGVGQYIRASSAECGSFVSAVERKELLSYLRGNTDTADQIQMGGIPSQEAPDADMAAAAADAAGGNTDALREARQQHAAKLEAAATRGVRAGLLPAEAAAARGGALGVSQDKLLELRAKRLSHKRQTITGDGDADAMAAVDPELLQDDRLKVKRICDQEICVSDRNKVLRWPGRDFSFALHYYQEIKRCEKERESANDDASYGKKRSRSGSSGSGGGSESRNGGSGEGRSERHTSSSGGGSSGGTSTPSASGGRSSSSGGGGGGGSHMVGPRSGPAARQWTGAPAIIIVPNTPSSMVTLYNAKQFLSDGRFEPSQLVKEQGDKKPANLRIERTLHNGQRMTYEVIDNPTRLYPQDWERVVCVLVQGVEWQFKRWQWEQPVTLFQTVLGVHLKYDDTRTLDTVAGWNVRVLEVNKHKRHLDMGASKEFWRLLDEFMLVHKSYLMR